MSSMNAKRQARRQFTILQVAYAVTLICIALACFRQFGVYPVLSATPFLFIIGTATIWDFARFPVSATIEWLWLGLLIASIFWPFVLAVLIFPYLEF